MKNLILFLLALCLSASVFSQLLDKSLSSFNLKSKVKEVNTHVYYYRSNQESFTLSSEDIMEFSKDGMLTRNLSTLYMLSSNYEYNYEYKGGRVDKQINKTIDRDTGHIKSERITDYVYENNRLSEIKYRGIDPTTVSYTYNEQNQVIKETKVGLGGSMIYEKNYTHTSKDNYFTSTYYYSKGVKGSKADEYYYENDKIVSAVFKSYETPTKSTYSYNNKGDKITYYYKGKLKTEYFYTYDKNNNWITKTEKTFNTYSENYTYSYSFRKIIYKNGSTGATDMNEAMVKSYEKRDSYEIKPYEAYSSKYSQILINPDKVKEMLVLKTSGSSFKVKTDAGNYLTNHVTAIKHTNGVDMIVYHPKSNTTAIVKDFNNDLFKRDFWHKAEIISSTDSVFWTVNEKGDWYIIVKGRAYTKYEVTKLKYSSENPDDVIVYVDGVATYVMKNYKSAVHHKLYVLRKI